MSTRECVGRLTEREQEILRWAANGKTSWEIGKILDLSSRTVEWHLNQVIQKLDASSRVHAVAIAISDDHITL